MYIMDKKRYTHELVGRAYTRGRIYGQFVDKKRHQLVELTLTYLPSSLGH